MRHRRKFKERVKAIEAPPERRGDWYMIDDTKFLYETSNDYDDVF